MMVVMVLNVILSDHRDLVPDQGQHGANQGQVPDIVIEPGVLNPNSNGGCAGGRSQSHGRIQGRIHFLNLRRYIANRGRGRF